MSVILDVVGLEGCGHHGLEAVIVNVINKHSNYTSREGGRARHIRHLLRSCISGASRNSDDYDIFGAKVKEYLENKNYLIYADDSYPSGGPRDNVRRDVRRQKNLVEINKHVSKYGEIRFLYLKRNIYNTINSHPHFDGGIIAHTKRLKETKLYIEAQIKSLRKENAKVFELNYEDIDNNTGADIISDFVNADVGVVKDAINKYFKKSRKNYTELLDEKTIQIMSEMIGEE